MSILVLQPSGKFTIKTTLADAAAAADAAGKTIICNSPQTLTSDLTLAADRAWRFDKGCLITTTGYTLTINGPFEAGNYQVFAGTGSVFFGGAAVQPVWPEWWGAVGDGITNDSPACRAAVAALPSGGKYILTKGKTYYTDTLTLNSYTTVTGGGTIKLISHATSHNPAIRVGNAPAAVHHVVIDDIIIDGNASQQTYTSEEWSPGIMVWGSDYNTVKNSTITNCKGDGITIGFDYGRVVGSNGNIITANEVYGNTRQGISITYGNENKITSNKISGNIDLELDASIGECKNNLVHGNSGRTQTENLTSPRISDLSIYLASLNTDKSRYFGNVVTNNHCAGIYGQYNDKTTIANNVIIGSYSTTTYLIDLAACDNTTVSGNTIIANTAVATSLAYIVRTRACSYLHVINNIVSNDAIVFHGYIATYSSEPTAIYQIFRDNNLIGSGAYRSGSAERASEWARFRIDQDPSGSVTLTQIGGVKASGAVVRSAGTIIISNIGGAGPSWLFDISKRCNATTKTAADMTHECSYTYTSSGSNRIVTMFTSAPAAGAVSLSGFSFASGGGTGTFFMDVWF